MSSEIGCYGQPSRLELGLSFSIVWSVGIGGPSMRIAYGLYSSATSLFGTRARTIMRSCWAILSAPSSLTSMKMKKIQHQGRLWLEIGKLADAVGSDARFSHKYLTSREMPGDKRNYL